MYRLIGKGRSIRDAGLKVRGALRYAADENPAGMLHAKLLLSPIAHGRIESVQAAGAFSVPGVRDVIWHEHVPDLFFNSAQRFYEHKVPENEKIFDRFVRFAGDRVAAVAADTREAAARAVRKIEVSYSEMPACFSIDEALAEGAPHVHSGGNLVTTIQQEAGDPDSVFARADHLFEGIYETPPVHQWALENHCCTAFWEGGKLTVRTTTQNVFAVRLLLSQIFSLPMNRVRVIKPPLGGAFGGKLSMVHEPVAAALAMRTGRPVRLELSRKESMIATRTRHASRVRVKSAVSSEGIIEALEIDLKTNTGAYCSAALNVVGAISHKVFKLYNVRNIRFTGSPVYTNLPVAGAMRGYGSPQVIFALEVHLREAAEALGIDPVEFHLKNLVTPESSDPRYGSSLGNPRPIDCVREGARLFGWESLRGSGGVPGPDGKFRGAGMAVGLHGNGVFGAHRDFTALSLKMNEDGTATLFTGTHDMGNGSVTIQTLIIAEELGIEPEDIECVESDTEITPWNLGDFASRGVFVSGEAARLLGKKTAGEILAIAAEMLSMDREELFLGKDGVCRESDGSTAAGLTDVLRYNQCERQHDLTVSVSYASIAGRTSYGAHFARVAVDPASGSVEVERYCAVHDVGRVLNPVGLEGQLEGGIHMGMGYALSEELVFDEKGICRNAGAGSYRLIKASEMPSHIDIGFVESTDEPGPYGAKSIGECATVPVAPAILNAVADALGRNFRSIPLAPQLAAEKDGNIDTKE
jgi:CO/xanthine dehydrogenase Mo-binding subunit